MAAPSFVDMATSHADRTAERLAAVAGIRRAPTPKLVQFMLPHFLDAETCTALIERIDRDARPSTIPHPHGSEAFRPHKTRPPNPKCLVLGKGGAVRVGYDGT